MKTRQDYFTLVRFKCCHRNKFSYSYKYIVIKKWRKGNKLI